MTSRIMPWGSSVDPRPREITVTGETKKNKYINEPTNHLKSLLIGQRAGNKQRSIY